MEDKAAALRDMRICRFCLTEKDPLSNIYEKDTKNAIPLPLQIMACIAIEVFSNDGMPQLICDDCRLQTRKSYSFKTMCRRSDDALKLFLTTGVLTKHEKEEILKSKSVQKRSIETEKSSAVPAAPKRIKTSETSTQVTLDDSDKTLQQIKSDMMKNDSIKNDHQLSNHPETETQPVEFIENVSSTEIEQQEEFESEYDESNSQSTPKSHQILTHCFSCNHCERSFPLQQLLDIHMRQHTRERKFSCSECDKKFFTKHDLTKHIQIHSGKKPFICVVCDKTFTRATLLHRHEKIHVSVPKYLCSYCDKTYLTSDDLDTHMLIHKKNRPYKCSQCEKSFAFKQGLERHLLTHCTTYLHKCNYCEESFTTPGKLARHVTSHAGTRPYPCKLCPRTFLLSHHRTRHLRNHYNRKPMDNEEFGEFKCDMCSMSFRRKDSLINHTAIHSMVNLKCLICNKEFSDAKTVKDHVSSHLSGLQFPCDKCDYSFETQEELEDHEAKHTDYYDDEEEEEEVEEEEDVEYTVEEIPATEDLEQQELLEEDEVVINDQQLSKIRRSQRESKIKNYADFLKDGLGSDSDEKPEQEETEPLIQPKVQTGTIQPVIRSETMKMYKGIKDKSTGSNKNLSESEKIIPDTPIPEPPVKSVENCPKSMTKITTLENLGISKQTLDAMTDKSGFVEMKLGQKVIRVQKLMMTKAEYQQMAKKGKLEIKGSTIVVQNMDINKLTQLSKPTQQDPLNESSKLSEQKVDMQPDVEVQLPKTSVKTYVKKVSKVSNKVENSPSESLQFEDTGNNIDLEMNPAIHETSIEETDILGKF